MYFLTLSDSGRCTSGSHCRSKWTRYSHRLRIQSLGHWDGLPEHFHPMCYAGSCLHAYGYPNDYLGEDFQNQVC